MAEFFGSVTRRSQRQIEELANSVRRELGVLPNERLSMQPVIEHAIEDMVDGAYFHVAPDGELAGAEARTDRLRPVITFSASAYADLSRGVPRARMTAAHELGHLLMHSCRPVFLYRTRARDHRFDPEWQADYFAGVLLMPTPAFRKMKTVSEAMRAFGVSRAAALRRARELNMQLFDDKFHRTGDNKKRGHGMNRAP